MPEVGDIVEIPEGKGQVVSKDILNRNYKVLVGNEKIEVSLGECSHDSLE